MRRSVARLVIAGAFATVLVALVAGPAGATTVLANDEYKWYYWVAPILAVSFFGVVGLLSLVYYRKVLIPKYRGRRVEE